MMSSIKIKNITLIEKIALILTAIALILQFMDGGVFGNNPIPQITKYHQILFWGGILIWAFGFIKKKARKEQQSEEK